MSVGLFGRFSSFDLYPNTKFYSKKVNTLNYQVTHMNKSFLVSGIFLLQIVFSQSLFSQDKDQIWFSNMDSVSLSSEKENKDILIVFSGSDWCRPCMKFKKEVLNQDDFQDFATKSLNILYLDFPAKKKNALGPKQKEHNELLAEEYNKRGKFPKIVLLNSKSEFLAEVPYRGQNVNEFLDDLIAKKKRNE